MSGFQGCRVQWKDRWNETNGYYSSKRVNYDIIFTLKKINKHVPNVRLLYWNEWTKREVGKNIGRKEVKREGNNIDGISGY